jgi:hypothetical protein
MGWVLDNVDVDVTSFERIDSCTSVHGVLVLVDLNDPILLVGTVTVPSKIIEVEEVGLSTLAGHHAHSSDAAALELAR